MEALLQSGLNLLAVLEAKNDETNKLPIYRGGN